MIYDVAIIGCGPVGALAANLLGHAGLSVLVVEQATDPHPLPRAVHLDHEMMRLFQSVGLSDRIAPGMRETQGHLHIGADGGVIRYMGTVGRPKPFGWAADYFFYQPELEAALRVGLERFPQVDLRVGTRLDDLAQDAGGVTLHLGTGDGGTSARCRWVIACDGARSSVRRRLGIPLEDLGFEEPWLVVDADVDDAVRFPDLAGVPAVADLQQLSVMMCDPVRPATVVPGRGRHRRWEFMLLPGEDETAMTEPDAVAALVAPYLEGVPHHILRATTYRFHGLVAERWRAGRVFLAGDAAHQTPPFFGQGMCHGMRDVANLAWKLALVRCGSADEALLDTYQAERDPHVRAVVTAALAAGRYICELDPAKAAVRDAQLRAEAEDGGAPSVAGDLIPAIASGVIAASSAGAGERFIQPIVGDTLLDDITGAGWRLFAMGADALSEAKAAASAVPSLRLRVIDAAAFADGGAIGDWLAERGARAVVVRPDFYVFGTTRDSVSALLEELQAAIGDSVQEASAAAC